MEASQESTGGIFEVGNLGHAIGQAEFERGVKELNSDVHFDLGGKHGLYHPRIDEWQGMFHNGRHVGSMSRGVAPEFTIYGLNKKGERVKVHRIGWRMAMRALVKADIPGITWRTLCAKFNVEYKHFRAHQPAELTQ